MKKIIHVLILTLGCFSAFSQGEIKNATYFSLDWTRPIMNYGELEGMNSTENLYRFYQNQYPDADHKGGEIEIGTSFYIHPTGFKKGYKAGILVDFIDLGATYMSFMDSTITIGNPIKYFEPEKCHDLTARYSLNIGVVGTYSPIKKLYFDLFAKIRPTFAVNYFKMPMFDDITDKIYTNNEALVYSPVGTPLRNKRVVEDTGIGLGFNYSFGFNIRYARVLIGTEWVVGKLKYTYNNPDMDQTVYDQLVKVKLGMFFAE